MAAPQELALEERQEQVEALALPHEQESVQVVCWVSVLVLRLVVEALVLPLA